MRCLQHTKSAICMLSDDGLCWAEGPPTVCRCRLDFDIQRGVPTSFPRAVFHREGKRTKPSIYVMLATCWAREY